MSSLRYVSQRLCGLWLMYIGVIVMLAVWFSGSDLLNVVLLGIGYVIGYVLIFMLPYASRRLVSGKSDRFQDIWDNISLGFMVIGCTLVGMLVGFDDVRLAWLLIFLVVGIHFIGFYFSQGMSMVVLGVSTIVLIVIGLLFSELPFGFVMVLDGLLKFGFGVYLFTRRVD